MVEIVCNGDGNGNSFCYWLMIVVILLMMEVVCNVMIIIMGAIDSIIGGCTKEVGRC